MAAVIGCERQYKLHRSWQWTFEPGARTKWHLHPDGQIILALGGTGYHQEQGSPRKILRKGDVVTCFPNVPHWHGASAD